MKATLYRLLPRLIGTEKAIQLAVAYARGMDYLRHGTADRFLTCAIELATHCNRGCWYCPQSVAPAPARRMGDDMLELVLERLRDFKFTGNITYAIFSEPLLDLDRLENALTRTWEVLPSTMRLVNTNGDRLSIEVARRLIAAGMTKCIISRHPPLSDSWDRRMAAVMEAFPRHVSMMEVKRVRNIGGAITAVALGPEDLTTPCRAPARTFLVRYNGDVGICCSDYDRQISMGNLTDGPIDRLWNNPRWRRLRRELAQGVRTEPICKKCNGHP